MWWVRAIPQGRKHPPHSFEKAIEMKKNTMLLRLRLNDPDLIKNIQQHCETYFDAGYELKSTVRVAATNELLLIFQRPSKAS